MAYVFLLHRPFAALLLSASLVACTTDVLSPPARIDSASRVGAIRPSRVLPNPEQELTAAYPAKPVPGFSEAPDAGMPVDPAEQGALPMIDSEPAATITASASPMSIPPEGVNMDAMLGVEPVVGLAEEQSNQIAEGGTAQPVVGGIGGETVRQLGGPAAPPAPQQAKLGYDPDLPPLAPALLPAGAETARSPVQQRGPRRTEEPQQVAFLPRARNPLAAPEYTGRMPASEIACRQQLKKLGVVYRDLPRIHDGPSCGIDYPIELSGLSGNIDVKPAVKLNCQVTAAFAKWVKYELAPSSRYRYWSGVKTIRPLGGYSCRTMNSRRGNPMSEHARGNAIDVGKFVLKNGKKIDVRKKGLFAFRERGLLKAVRADSCKYFNTVLGPGSDRQHKDHFHFDLRTRKSGYRHCD